MLCVASVLFGLLQRYGRVKSEYYTAMVFVVAGFAYIIALGWVHHSAWAYVLFPAFFFGGHYLGYRLRKYPIVSAKGVAESMLQVRPAARG